MRTNSGTSEALGYWLLPCHRVTKNVAAASNFISIYGVEGEPGVRQKQNVYQPDDSVSWRKFRYAAHEGGKELKQQGYPGGVKLTTKELRDYFATQVSAQVTDPNTVKELMQHRA